MMDVLDEHECWALLSATTIGRVGLQRERRFEIIPVNYLLDGTDIVFRTRSDGILSHLDNQDDVAFEVDHHDDLGSTAWSVLLNGTARTIPAEDAEQLPGVDRVQPWADGERMLWVRVVVQRITGRRVHRRRNA